MFKKPFHSLLKLEIDEFLWFAKGTKKEQPTNYEIIN